MGGGTLVVLAAEGPHWGALGVSSGLQAGSLPGRAAWHRPPPRSFSCDYCCLPDLAPVVTNSFILMCEWLQVFYQPGQQRRVNRGKGVSQEASSAPLQGPSHPLPFPLWLSRSPRLSGRFWSGCPLTAVPSGGTLPPGTSYMPTRAACSLPQLQCVPCLLPGSPARPPLRTRWPPA